MPSETSPKLLLGTGNIGDSKTDPLVRFDTSEEVEALLESFYQRGHRQIDTAQAYSVHAHGSCEPRLGNAKAGERFLLDTKIWSLKPGSHKKENVLKGIDTSLERLQVRQINILYLHHPDRSVPFEETCEALHMAYSQGKFKHWGLSNYAADEVSQIVDLCDRKGWQRPSVYQGQYNPIVRGAESDLFPILRKYGMSFYAYSPAAAGFFAGNHKNIKPGGRFDTSHFLGDLYSKQYVHEGVIAATERALAVAAGHGIGGHAAAVRWCAYSSALRSEHGDAIILGASSVTQLDANIDLVEQGRLPDDVVAALEAVYDEVKSAGAEIAYHW